MISIGTVLSALATAALATGFNKCNFSELTGGQQCFGAAGQLFLFHLPNTANMEMTLKKDNKYVIFKVKNQKVTLNENYTEPQNEAEFFASGTLILGNAMKKHSGKYVLEIFDPNGNLLKKINVHLEIQEPVSEPAVSQMCVSPEQMKVRCSSKGDGVELSMKLAGQLLLPTGDQSPSPRNWTANRPSLADSRDKQDKSSVSELIISLHGQLTGSLKCIVTNKVSRHETVIHLTSCKDSLSSPLVVTVPVIVGVVTLLVLLALGVTIKNLQNKQRPTTVTGGNFEDEVVYTDVRLNQLSSRW
ncbi:T-cell surface antigen CD2-like [Channa argus]|uniref:T-cell surface antigen CD2-like n=1 Tax=Channa argus TaxID=215402 RepID=UPI0035220FC5